MKLIDPTGVIVSTSDELGAKLLKMGYREVPEVTPEPVPAPKPPRKKSSKS